MAGFAITRYRGSVCLTCWQLHCELEVLDPLMLRIVRTKFFTNCINADWIQGRRESYFDYGFRNRGMFVRELRHSCIQTG